MSQRTLAGATFVLLSLLSSVASADVAVRRHSNDGDYYRFTDDLLNSDVRGPHGARITVRPSPMRSMLLRPRTQFVTEMLKSVENI